MSKLASLFRSTSGVREQLARSSSSLLHSFRLWLVSHPVLALALVLWVLVYYQTWLSIVNEWQPNAGFGHGSLTLLFSLYLIFIQARSVPQPHFITRLLGLVAMIFCGLAWWVGSGIFVLSLEQVAWAFMAYAILMAYFGFRWLLVHWIPLFLPLLGIPFWARLVSPLRELSTDVSETVLRFIGDHILNFPILRDGYFIQIAGGGVFHVEDACSGLGFLLTGIFISLAFVAMHRLKWPAAVAAVLISLLFALLANWVRIVLIVLAGQQLGMDHEIVRAHLAFGWLVFGFCLLPMIWSLKKLSRFGQPDPEPEPSVALRGANRFAAMACVLVLAPVAIAWYSKSTNTFYKPTVSPALPINSVFWQPHFEGATETHSWVELVDGQAVEVFLAYYETESPSHELIYVKNQAYHEGMWASLRKEQFEVEGFGPVVHQILTRGLSKAQILYWYDVGGVRVNSGVQAKIQALRMLAERRSGSAYLGLGLRTDQGSEEANRALLLQAAKQVVQ